MTGNKFISELHLKQPGSTCKDYRLFTIHRERIQKFRENCNLKHLYRNELDKAYFTYDATHSESKDLAKKII